MSNLSLIFYLLFKKDKINMTIFWMMDTWMFSTLFYLKNFFQINIRIKNITYYFM